MGQPFQSKFNAWTSGKNIGQIHDVAVATVGGSTRALVTYEALPGESSKENRVFAKVIEGPVGESATQTKVNSWSKGKDVNILKVASAVDGDGNVTVLILHTKAGGEESNGDS